MVAFPDKLRRLLNGEALVVTSSDLDSFIEFDESNLVKTCINLDQVGTQDRYIAWVSDKARPQTLFRRRDDMMAGSIFRKWSPEEIAKYGVKRSGPIGKSLKADCG